MLYLRRQYHELEGLLIKYYRLLRGISQEELADRCHFEKSFVSEVEAGKNITRDTRITFARALCVEPHELCHCTVTFAELKQTIAQMNAEHQKEKKHQKRNRRKKIWRRKKKAR